MVIKRELVRKLSEITPDADFEAGVILEEAVGRDWRLRELRGELLLTDVQKEKIAEMLRRRLLGEPLQYIVGEWEFCGLSFKVGKGVLIPRQDTETLVDEALRLIEGVRAPTVVDLCSGTGCVAAAVKHSRPDACVAAIELYPEAYGILCENAERYGIKAVLGDVLSAQTAEMFSGLDLITANPPYLTKDDMGGLSREVRYEPEMALFGGDDGLKFYRIIPAMWRESLRTGGAIAFEIGLGQEKEVIDVLKREGYRAETAEDLTRRIRVVTGVKI